MTINKPEVVGYISDRWLKVLTSRWLPVHPIGVNKTERVPHGLVRLSNYEALQAECERLSEEAERKSAITGDYIARCRRLQYECDRLRQRAELARARAKKLDLALARYLLGMQSAVIEAEHGKGAEAGMTWIWNGLAGPGLVPDDGETDAQAYFDREIKHIDAAMQEVT